MGATNPELNSMLNITNQQTGNQAMALAGAVYAYAANIDSYHRGTWAYS